MDVGVILGIALGALGLIAFAVLLMRRTPTVANRSSEGSVIRVMNWTPRGSRKKQTKHKNESIELNGLTWTMVHRKNKRNRA
jgi:hypothetical protein